MEKRKRILFVISYIDFGGAERALSNLTRFFPEEYELDILVNDDTVVGYSYKANILSMRMKEKPNTSSVFFQMRVMWKRIRTLRRLKRQGGYDACVSFLDSANIANILSGKKHTKVIVSVRNSLRKSAEMPQYKFVVNPLVRLLYNRADKVVAVSRGVAEELTSLFHIRKEKVVAIENGYDVAEIRRMAEASGTDGATVQCDKPMIPGGRFCVTAGRLNNQKGHWHLIRAFSEVVKAVPDAKLLILGEGELREYLEALVRAYHLEERVLLPGSVKNPYQYERAAEFYVMPSLFEGFPNALAEAVCLGKPCIAADFQTGAREILAPELLGEPLTFVQEKGAYEGSYGVLTPVCSGVKYEAKTSEILKEATATQGAEQAGARTDFLEPAEQRLAEAMIRMFEDEVWRAGWAEKSRQRSRDLSMEESVKEWISIL